IEWVVNAPTIADRTPVRRCPPGPCRPTNPILVELLDAVLPRLRATEEVELTQEERNVVAGVSGPIVDLGIGAGRKERRVHLVVPVVVVAFVHDVGPAERSEE